MIQSELVDKRKILSQQKIYDGILIASLLPGPLAVNVVTYIGYGLRGWPGAIVCGISILLPACSIMTIMAYFSSVFFDHMTLARGPRAELCNNLCCMLPWCRDCGGDQVARWHMLVALALEHQHKPVTR